MRLSQVLITLSLSLWLVLGDIPVTEKHPDIPKTLKLGDQHILNRVQKIVRITYPYTLNNNNQWTQFPDMAISYYVPFDQYVQIRYKIVTLTGSVSYFVTRMMLDGKQNVDFRCHTGNYVHHVCTYQQQVWVPKGYHSAILQYRTPSSYPNLGFYNWNIALFKVKYYEMP